MSNLEQTLVKCLREDRTVDEIAEILNCGSSVQLAEHCMECFAQGQLGFYTYTVLIDMIVQLPEYQAIRQS